MNVGARRLVGMIAGCCCLLAANVGLPQSARVVRVGVVVFESGPGDSSADPMWQQLFAGWEARSGLEIVYAKGTHSDVLHWMHNRVVDAVVLPAGALVQEQKVEREADRADAEGLAWSLPSPHFEYVATFGYPPATTDFADDDRRQPGFHWFSRSVCVVSNDSDLDSREELLEAVRRGAVHFLMVHPYSASGSLLPRAFLLEQLGAALPSEQVEYTFSHTESLERLAASGPGVAAFVWDGALDVVPELAGSLKRIELPGLTEKRIPNETLLVRSGSPHLDTLRSLATADDGTDRLSFRRFDDWQARYGQVAEWTRRLRVPDVGFETRRLSLDEVGWLVLYSARSQQPLPRLAVVLSGGGAKCSYQVGVLEALEEKLAAMRQSIPHLSDEQRACLDIQLVVGTSGGAINALPVAMGVSTTEAGQRAFQRAWMKSDQREILRPPTTQRLLMGFWFGLLQIGALAWLLRKIVRDDSKLPLILAASLVAVGSAQLIVGELSWSPWRFLGTNHVWHHLFLLFTLAVRASAWVLLLAGAASLVMHWLFRGRGDAATRAYGLLARVLVVLLAVLPVVGLVHLLFRQQTLSDGSGVEKQLVATYSKLIEEPPGFAGAGRRDKIRLLSIAAEERLQRDLVITGTCLPRTGPKSEHQLPDDLYFYARPARGDPDQEPTHFGVRGVSLNDPRYRHLLLDVIMGSGSIFPVFPARVLRDFPVEGESVELVDGGFAHNSPIEAAVMWGATHVVVIEASPESRSSRKNFIANVAAAVGHLQQQTAQVDRRSKQHVRVFTLEPRPPHLCILCFADNLIERAVCNGYFDATGTRHPDCREPADVTDDRTAAGHWFEEDLGPPQFVEVGPAE